MLWISPGFAHGFLVLSDWADVLYKTTEYFAAEFERTLAWNDHKIGIRWPIPQGQAPILSAKDASGVPVGQRRSSMSDTKTVLVTGGAGFIGSNFIHYLQRSNRKPMSSIWTP